MCIMFQCHLQKYRYVCLTVLGFMEDFVSMSYLSLLLSLEAAAAVIEIWFLECPEESLVLFVRFELLMAAGIRGMGM